MKKKRKHYNRPCCYLSLRRRNQVGAVACNIKDDDELYDAGARDGLVRLTTTRVNWNDACFLALAVAVEVARRLWMEKEKTHN